MLNSRSSDADRIRAARLVGIDPDTSIRVAAIIETETAETELWSERARGVFPHQQVLRDTVMDGRLVVLLASGGDDPEPVVVSEGVGDIRVGIGGSYPLRAASRSLSEAITALRLTRGPGAPSVVDFHELGAIGAVASLPRAALASNEAVLDIDRLVALPGGDDLLETLEQVCQTNSLRQAAEKVHMHHTSISYRIGRIEDELGYSLNDGEGRLRAQMSIVLWRLSLPD